MKWRFEILGPLRVTADGAEVRLASGRVPALLATLLVRPNQVVRADDLVDLVWEEPPANAKNSLHVLVGRLRRALGDPSRVRTEAGGYQLAVLDGELDLDDFQAELSAADAATRRGDTAAERMHLVAALETWRGPVLAGVDIPDGDSRAAGDLEERRLAAMSRRIELDLGDSAPGAPSANEVVDELRSLTSWHPLRERFWTQLMRALRRGGRQAEALATFDSARRLFAEELGVEPGTELRDMHAAILADDGAETELRGSARSSADEDDDVAGWQAVCQLPAETADFVGRRVEGDQLAEKLTSERGPRVAIVWGSPGVGKSTFAVAVAHRIRGHYPNGQLYVRLEGASSSPREPGAVLEDLLLALGMPPGMIPRGTEARSAALRARVADREILLVLDDASDAEQVLPLMPGTPESAVLITCRQVLPSVAGAGHLRLDPLAGDAAVGMLDRLLGSGRVEAEPAAATELAELCGGLPLALRIVGGRLLPRPESSLAHLAGRLRDERTRLGELSTEGLEVRSSFETSYASLEPPIRNAFHCLALLPPSGFAPWALGALADGSDGERLVEALTSASLLSPLGTDAAGQCRYRPHDLVRLYAQEFSEARGAEKSAAALRRLLDMLLGYGAAVYRRTARSGDELPLDEPADVECHELPAYMRAVDPDTWVEAEQELLLHTIDAACARGWCDDAARLADYVIPAMHLRGGFERLRTVRIAVRDAAHAAGDELVAWRAECGRAEISVSEDLGEAERIFLDCVAAFTRLGAVDELAHSLTGVVFCRTIAGRGDLPSARRALDIAEASDKPTTRILARRTYADALMYARRPNEALPLLRRALVEAERLDNPGVARPPLAGLARCALMLGRLDEAAWACDRAAAITTDLTGLGWTQQIRCRIETARGNFDEAVVAAGRSREILVRVGDRRGVATTLVWLADAYLQAGRGDEARGVVDAALPTLREVGANHVIADAERIGAQAGRLTCS